MVRRVVKWNREGEYTAAKAFLSEQLVWFERYCDGLPNGASLVAQVHDMLMRCDQEWTERGRKEIGLSHYKRARGDQDLRSHKRPDWDDFMSKK